MKYRKSARPLALAIASMLALQPVSAFAVTFADINQVPWPGAEVSINKAADLGLVVGETKNGKNYFRPKDTVSLSESCQFAYKVMLQTKKATANSSVTEKWKTVMNTYNIQEWAHPAVAFCLEKGIISIPDLSSFVKNGVNMPASREQAGEILGRALAVGIPSYTANASATKFGDNSSIASDARPYIALLNDKGIISGDDLGNFNPKKTLNRTETAVMITNLYEKLNSVSAPVTPPAATSQKASGTVATITANYVNLKDSTAYYRFYSSYSVTLNGETTTVDKLVTLFKEGSVLKVDLDMTGDYLIRKLTATVEEAEGKLTKGTLTGMTFNEKKETGTITIEKTSKYSISDTRRVDIEIDDKDYDYDEFHELYEYCKEQNDSIEVKLTLDKDDEITKIVGEVKENGEDTEDEEESSSQIKSMSYDYDDEDGSIKVGNKTYKFDEDDDIDIEITDADNDDITDIEELYEAVKFGKIIDTKITVKNDKITKITGKVIGIEGLLADYGDDYLEIEVSAKLDGKNETEEYKYYFTENSEGNDDWEKDLKDIKVNIDGISSGNMLKFYEWLEDYHRSSDEFDLKLTLDKNGMITKVTGEYKD